MLSRVCVSVVLLLVSTCTFLTLSSVSGDGEVCYPYGCSTYTSPFPANELNEFGVNRQFTTWEGLIGVDKFNPANTDAVLQKVTINTKVYFKTAVYVTCTDSDTCLTNFKGTAKMGMEFSMDLDGANKGKLPDYWGRWGDHPLTTELADEYVNDVATGQKLFQPYTYPLFDLAGAEDEFETDELALEFVGGKRWAYYRPTANGGAEFWYGSKPPGIYVVSDEEKFYRQERLITDPEVNAVVVDQRVFGQNGGPATPKDVEVHLTPDVEFNHGGAPYSKSVSRVDDGNGGVANDITPASILDLFTGAGQISFRTNATGFYNMEASGGNYNSAQVSTAYVEVQVRYEYSGTLGETTTAPPTTPAPTNPPGFNGDPQFSGFHGQSFQVHGYPGSYFHLVSAPSFQMNGRFAYLANGHCHYKHTPCWTHPGTYIDDITFIVDELLVRVTAGAVGQGYTISINDEPFHAHQHDNDTDALHDDVRAFVPTKFYDAATRLTVHLRSPLELSVRTELFAFVIHNADHFFNVDSQLLVRPILVAGRAPSAAHPHPVSGAPWFPAYPLHGFIGQTWANATYAAKKRYQGDVDDYVETRPYATESLYSQYGKQFDQHHMKWD